jgi:hypothetical protein
MHFCLWDSVVLLTQRYFCLLSVLLLMPYIVATTCPLCSLAHGRHYFLWELVCHIYVCVRKIICGIGVEYIYIYINFPRLDVKINFWWPWHWQWPWLWYIYIYIYIYTYKRIYMHIHIYKHTYYHVSSQFVFSKISRLHVIIIKISHDNIQSWSL